MAIPNSNTDPIVGHVYESFDYSKFKTLAENRGQKETKGIKERKINTLQKMIEDGTWVHEMSRIRVNLNFEVVDGAHTLEICKRNALPVRYEITDAPGFNEVSKRDLIGSVYSINSVTTSWTSAELFAAAVQTKAPLALIFNEIIDAENNYFLWTDLMALVQRDTGYFMGHWRGTNMGTFEKKTLLEVARSQEFALEVKFFVKLNNKARIAFKKGVILKCAYDILWHVRDMVNPKLFRKALESIPEHLITSQRATTDDNCRRLLLQHYNKSQGQQVETATVLYELKHRPDKVEELLEII